MGASTTAAAKTATADKPPTTTKQPRERRSFTTRLDGASGAQMRVTAARRRDGTAQTCVVHTTTDGKKKINQRGATEEHPTIDAARAHAEVLVRDLTKLGWKTREPRGGFPRKPDAFDAAHLPGPGAEPAKGTKFSHCSPEPGPCPTAARRTIGRPGTAPGSAASPASAGVADDGRRHAALLRL